jgi:hypothetical protein
MKTHPKFEAWTQSEEAKRLSALLSRKIKELEILIPKGKSMKEATEDQKPKIKNVCNEIGSYIDSIYNIKPDPDSVYEFLLDEVDPWSFWQKPDLDELVILYAEWRAKKIHTTVNQISENILNTFKTDYTLSQLKTIRERLIKTRLIDNISENAFIYIFTGKPITKRMKRIIWKKKPPLGHSFLKRVVYQNEQFNFKQIEECFIFPKGHILDSNDKSRSDYSHNDILNPILNV